jgi:hypothetical protein
MENDDDVLNNLVMENDDDEHACPYDISLLDW